MRINEIIKIVDSDLTKFTESEISSWQKPLSERMAEVKKIVEKNLSEIESVAGHEPQEAEFWERMEGTIQELSNWIDSLQLVDEEQKPDVFWHEWRSHFSGILSKIPTSVRLSFTEKSIQASTRDVLRVRFLKKFQTIKLWFRKAGLPLINTVRRMRGMPDASVAHAKRSFSVHLFLQRYLEQPFADLILREWQRFLQEYARQINRIHASTDAQFYLILGSTDPGDSSAKPKPEDVLQGLRNLAEEIATNSIEPFKASANDRVKNRLDEIFEDIRENWKLAGSEILSNSSFNGKSTLSQWKFLETDFQSVKSSWQRHLDAEMKDWKRDNDLLLLRIRSAQICKDTLKALDKKIEEEIKPTFVEPAKMISDSLDRFQKASISGADLEDEILSESRTTIRSLRRQLLPETMGAIAKADLTKSCKSYLSRIQHLIKSLTDEFAIMLESDLDSLKPESKVADIALKDLILEEHVPGLSTQHESFLESLEQMLDKVSRDISEIDQIIEFNLEAALERLGNQQDIEAKKEAKDGIVDGLERAQNRLNDVIGQCDQISGLCKTTLQNLTLELIDHIQDLADNEKIMDLKLRMARARTREEFRDLRRKVLNRTKHALPAFMAELRRLFKKSKHTYLRFRQVSGLTPVSADVDEKLSQFVIETQQRIDKLPFVYQSLFKVQPLEDERFFQGRDEDLGALKREYMAWQSGHFGATALIGEKGSGKTTTLNFARRQVFAGMPVTQIDLAGTTTCDEKGLVKILQDFLKDYSFRTIDELEGYISEAEIRRVIIVEDIQNLFLKTVDGFEALQRFLLLISRTHDSIFWVVSCTLYSWNYLDKVLDLTKYFQRVISMISFSQEDLEGIVLKRHRVSGYKLRFEPSEEIRQSKKFKKLAGEEAQQDYLRQLYFAQLNKLAMGNITVTMMFWLSAILEIREDTMFISLDPVDASFMVQLPNDELFTLAALIQHEMLNAEEHATIFNQEEDESLLLLTRMANRGILYKRSEGNYQINFMFYRATVRALSIKNIIH